MNIQDHLSQRLKFAWSYEPSDEDKKAFEIEGAAAYIFRKLKSKKFRKTKLDEDSEKAVKHAIKLNVDAGKPIKITYPFGAYKIWRVPSYPTVDWAEFMSVAHVISYVAPILSMYEPGVEIAFSADDIVIELLDNYPREDLDAYIDSFQKLISEFSSHFPINLTMTLQRVADMYTREEYDNELNQNYNKFKAEGLPDDRIAKDLKYSEFNFQVKGKEDLSKLTKHELEAKKLDLMYWSQAYLALSKRREFVRGEDKIVLFSQPISAAIDIGSTKVSKAKFWVGTGVLEHVEGKVFERILSPQQYEAVRKDGKDTSIDLIDLPNFDKILVFEHRLNFLNLG